MDIEQLISKTIRMQLSFADRAYIKQNYNFNHRQFNALQKAYKMLSHRFNLQQLLEKYRKLAFTPDQMIKFAEKFDKHTPKIRYIPKQQFAEETRQPVKQIQNEITDYKKERQQDKQHDHKKEKSKYKQKQMQVENQNVKQQSQKKQVIKEKQKDKKTHEPNTKKQKRQRNETTQQKSSNGLYLQGQVDFSQPVKVYYELLPDGSIRNFGLQSLFKH